MKTKNFILLGVITLGVMMGCNGNHLESESPESPELSGNIAVNLKIDVEAENDEWEAADRAGFFMKRAGQALNAPGAVYGWASNEMMIIENGTLVSMPQLMYPETGNVDIIAYYPHATVDAEYTIPVSVAGQGSGLPAEVLYSNNVINRAPAESAVTLNFAYLFAKIEITVTAGANTTLSAADFGEMTATVQGMPTQANLQLADGTFTERRAHFGITLHKTGSDETSATFETLVLPTKVTAGEIAFIFIAGGQYYRCEPSGNYESSTAYSLKFELEGNQSHNMKATLTNTVITPRTVTERSFTVTETIQGPQPHPTEHDMVFVQGGTFTMGCNSSPWSLDRPEHQVTLNSFYIGKYEVTQAQWIAVMNSWYGHTQHSFGTGDHYPVYFVSWIDVQEFITRLNTLTGKNYRLPTNAEWEYAARGGAQSKGYIFSGSNNFHNVAWFKDNISGNIEDLIHGNLGYGAQSVGTKAPNELGIYDMSGNVWEWCNDWLDKETYPSEEQNNPAGTTTGEGRVLRGGSWNDSPWAMRVSRRCGDVPHGISATYGFRLACSSDR